MAKCKITVLKRTVNQDLINDYGKEVLGPCDQFTDGQEFLLEGADKPEDFCSWAWADIHRDLMIIYFEGDVPWIEPSGTHITCCTDGLRPVVFKIERID